MKEKKNIDRLFQERLRDFESTPDNQVWINIEAELKKDKKRRVIPIWFKYSGIAAAFILGLFLLKTNQPFEIKKESRIVSDAKISKDSSNKKQIGVKKNSKNTQKGIKFASNFKENTKYKKEIINTNFSKSLTKNEKEISTYRSSEVLADQKKNQNKSNFYLSKNNLSINQPTTNESNSNYSSQITDKKNVTNSNSFVDAQNQTIKKDLTEKETPIKQPSNNAETPNELEEILKAKSAPKNAVASNSKNKWQITPNIGQVYLNANSGGSPIDNQLSNYEKKSDKSMSFGVGVRYAVSKKIVFRTGINKVTLGYNTDNVLFATGLTADNLRNIEYSSDNAVKFVNGASYNSLTTSEKGIQNTNTGTLNQKMGYYELPLEVSYAVLNKKFGINLIGGFSTLFLNENTISLESSQSNIELGEAKNLNQIHFSTNVGLGFKYQLIKSFQLSFEPVLKYQFNTFSKDSNNFSPMYIGLYSGVSYQF
jgi:hypothetical protein